MSQEHLNHRKAVWFNTESTVRRHSRANLHQNRPAGRSGEDRPIAASRLVVDEPNDHRRVITLEQPVAQLPAEAKPKPGLCKHGKHRALRRQSRKGNPTREF